MGLAAETTGDTHGAAIADFVNICVWAPNRAKMSYSFRSALIGTIAMTPTAVRAAGQKLHIQNPANLLAQAPNYEALFIVGDEEEVVNPDTMIELFKPVFPRLEIVRVPGAGHTVYWERPEETKRAIIGFVDRVLKL